MPVKEKSRADREPVRTVDFRARASGAEKNDPEKDEPPRALWQRGFLAVEALPHIGIIPI
jgi:hypothetical protein